MSCRRAHEIDLPGFLQAPQAEEFEDFRDHYPGCAACAPEVGAWTELHALLELERGDHPDEDALLRFEEGGRALVNEERAQIQRHLDRCHTCRDEIAALRGFAPARVTDLQASLEDDPSLVQRSESRRAARREERGRVARAAGWLLHPALAWGLVALLAYPTVSWLLEPPDSEPVLAARSKVERERSPAAPAFESARARREKVPAPTPSPEPVPVPVREEPATMVLSQEAEEIAAPVPEEAQSPAEPQLQAAESAGAEEPAAEAPAPDAAVEPQPLADAPAESRPAEAPAPAPDSLRLEEDTTLELAPGAAASPLALELVPKVEIPAGSLIDVRIVDATRDRELRVRLEAPGPPQPIEVKIPAGWLTPGEWKLEIRARGPAARFEPIAVFTLLCPAG